MKRSTIILSLLFSAPLLATMPMEEAQSKIASSRGRVKGLEKRVQELKAQIEKGHEETQQISGKEEYAADMRRRKAGVRKTMDQYNKAVEELIKAEQTMSATIKEVGKSIGRDCKVVCSGEEVSVTKTEEKELEPIVVQSEPSARHARTR